jgi:hypothetical protein
MAISVEISNDWRAQHVRIDKDVSLFDRPLSWVWLGCIPPLKIPFCVVLVHAHYPRKHLIVRQNVLAQIIIVKRKGALLLPGVSLLDVNRSKEPLEVAPCRVLILVQRLLSVCFLPLQTQKLASKIGCPFSNGQNSQRYQAEAASACLGVWMLISTIYWFGLIVPGAPSLPSSV